MTLKIVEVSCRQGHADTLRAAAEVTGAVDVRLAERTEDGFETLRLVVESKNSQRVLDAVERTVSHTDEWRINIIPLEATLPRPRHPTGEGESAPGTGSTREEIYNDIAANARINPTYLLLVVLSTVVAAIGLVGDNIAVVIGAMIVAPLLGPNLAFALGGALGDTWLMGRAMTTNLVGVVLTLLIAVAIGVAVDDPTTSSEMMTRTDVGLAGIALAFASGAAAALSVTTGISAALVGVMVAVALLPPAATGGIMLGAGLYQLAAGALILLVVNVVSVNVAAQLVFFAGGVRPNKWLETKDGGRRAALINLAVWIGLLILLGVYVVLRAEDLAP